MFIPLFIRQDYQRRPWASAILCGALVFTYLYFLVFPTWILGTPTYEEYLRLFSFNAKSTQFVRFASHLSYIFAAASPWVLLLDLAGILFFGIAVETFLGWWRFLLIAFISAGGASLAHGYFSPQTVTAGATGAAFGLLGAALAIYAFSETTGLAFFVWPFPPKAIFGLREVPTIFVMIAYAAGAAAWSIFAPVRNIQILSWQGMAGGFAAGALAAFALLRNRAPVFRPSELDPSHILRRKERELRERLERELSQDGLLSGATAPSVALPEDASPRSDVLAEFPAPDEPSPEAGQSLMEMKAGLIKLLQLQHHTDLASAYSEFADAYPDEALDAGQQMELGAFLEKHFHFELALDAFDRLARLHPKAAIAPPALFRAAQTCLQIPGREKEGLRYVERFLSTKPLRGEEVEALRLSETLLQAAAKAAGEHLPASEAAARVEPGGFNRVPDPEGISWPFDFDYEEEEEAGADALDSEKTAAAARRLTDTGAQAPRSPAAAPTRPFGAVVEEGVQFSLIFAPKAAMNPRAVAEVIALRSGDTVEGAIESLQRGKGIILSGLALDEAVRLRRKCADKDQTLEVVAQTEDLNFSTAKEADSLTIEGDSIRWKAGGAILETRCDEALLLSAGSVRVPPQTGHRRRTAMVYFREPKMSIQLWENTLRYSDSPALSGLERREAFTAVCMALSAACPQAVVTHGFDRLAEASAEVRPLSFRSQAEFDNYNVWHLLARFGQRI